MLQLETMYVRQSKYLFYMLALFVLGWGFTPYKKVFLGLIFGTAVGLFNLWILFRKSKRIGQAIEKKKKMYSMGMSMRMMTAGVSVFIAMRYPDLFHLYSVVFGLMTSYIVILIDVFISKPLESSGEER
jgi:ATP synthase protein I